MTVCAAVLVAGAAGAQETPSFPARDLPAAYDTYPRLSFHDVSLGYGVMPINDVTGIMDDLLPSLVGTGEIAKRKTGSVNMGYMYRLTPSLTVGGMFVYSGNMSSTVGGGYIYDNFYSILPQVKFVWYRSGIVGLYSRLAAGVLIADRQYQVGPAVDDGDTAATFTFQVSPIGVELGRTIAGFAEAGFGATGVLTLGVRARF